MRIERLNVWLADVVPAEADRAEFLPASTANTVPQLPPAAAMAPGAHQRANRQSFLDSHSPEQHLANIRVDRRWHHYTTLDLVNKWEEARGKRVDP